MAAVAHLEAMAQNAIGAANPDSHQYVDNDSTYRRKSVKQMGRNLHPIRKNSDNCEQGKPYPQEQANVRIEEGEE